MRPAAAKSPCSKALSGEWADRDVTVVGIAVDHREQVSAFAKELKIGYPVLIGEQDALDVAGALGVESPVFPFTVFTDRRGEVVALFVGELHQAQANLILSVVQNLNEDRLALSEARRHITEGLQQPARPASRAKAASGEVRRRSLPFQDHFWLISRIFYGR